MEEVGTEIVLQPGANLDLLQCVVTEPAKVTEVAQETASTDESLPSPCMETIEKEEKKPITPPSIPLVEEEKPEEEQREEFSTSRAFFPEPAQEEPPAPEVNRYDSLVESESADEEEESASDARDESPETTDDNFHPALKAAVHTEGQEAVWHEDEYSTVSSVYYVKPEKEVLPRSSKNPRRKIKVPFFKRGKKAQKAKSVSEDADEPLRPVKIHIKTKKIAKAVVLLPPKEAMEQNNDEEAIELEHMMSKLAEEGEQAESLDYDNKNGDNEEGAEYSNAIDLTETPIDVNETIDLTMVEDDEVIVEKDEHVVENDEVAVQADEPAVEDDEPAVEDDEPAIEDDEPAIEHDEPAVVDDEPAVVDDEPAVVEDAPAVVDDEPAVEEDTPTIEENKLTIEEDTPTTEEDESLPSEMKEEDKFYVSEYAARAVNFLESILPTNIGNDKYDGGEINLDDDSISTLGLRNDTQEYELDTFEDDTYETPDDTRFTDMMSLSSLNEILDGNGTVADRKRSQVEKYAVPGEEGQGKTQSVQGNGASQQKNPKLSPTHQKKKRSGLLRRVTPKLKPNIFFRKTPRANDGVPSQLNLVLDDEPREDTGVISSAQAVEKMVGDADSCVVKTDANRYDPIRAIDRSKSGQSDRYRMIEQDDEIELKLTAAATEEDKSSKSVTIPESDEMSEDINRLQSASFEEVCDNIVQSEKARTDSSPVNADENQDRYRTEPLGATPRRDGVLEENTNRKFHVDESEIAEEEDAVVTKEEQGEEKLETEKLESTETSNVEPSVEEEDKEGSTDESEEVVAATKNDETQKETPSKGLSRVVGMIGQNKRKPLVPNSVVEENYLVDKTMKKISTGQTPTNMSRKTKKNRKPPIPTSKPTVAQRAIEQVKKNPTYDFDDSSTVVRKAMSNGALKAIESNEEEDSVVPTNYLSTMLKKKVRARYTDMGEPVEQESSEVKNDEDSYVAKIRGPHPKEAPGVALEEVAKRSYKKNRDPSTGNGVDEVAVDLAPTPKRPNRNMFKDEQQKAEKKARDIARKEEEEERRARDIARKEEEEERQRRKMITERLFKAGLPSFHDEVNKKSEDALKTAPTAATFESDCDDPVKENTAAKKDMIQKIESHSRNKAGRGRRKLAISFLKKK